MVSYPTSRYSKGQSSWDTYIPSLLSPANIFNAFRACGMTSSPCRRTPSYSFPINKKGEKGCSRTRLTISNAKAKGGLASEIHKIRIVTSRWENEIADTLSDRRVPPSVPELVWPDQEIVSWYSSSEIQHASPEVGLEEWKFKLITCKGSTLLVRTGIILGAICYVYFLLDSLTKNSSGDYRFPRGWVGITRLTIL